MCGFLYCFWNSKKSGKTGAVQDVSREMIEKYLTWTELKGRFLKLFTLAIFLPVAPDDFLCYLAGTTNMTWKQFVTVIFWESLSPLRCTVWD